jgi:hypothetical protein
LNEKRFLKFIDTSKYMEKHKLSTEKHESLMRNIEFAKEFFEILDTDGFGVSL